MLLNLFFVMAGSAIGGGIRFFLTFLDKKIDLPFQISTLIVNIGGGLFVGALAALFLHKPDSPLRAFFILGICGGLTTFSSFSLETMNLLKSAQYLTAFATILMHFTGALVATFIGYTLFLK